MVKEWIKVIEIVISLITMTDAKNDFIYHLPFRVDTKLWHKITLKLADVKRLTWTEFQEIFDTKYKAIVVTFMRA